MLLMAAKFGVPVCPHAGGVGLCEYVQHLAIFDYLRVGASLDGRMVEYVDHLHEHFIDPVVIRDGRYLLPTAPGYSVEHEARVDRAVLLPGRPGVALTTDPARAGATLHRPAAAMPPAACAGATPAGIVHLGLGAFHRAHQAVYTEEAVAAGRRRLGHRRRRAAQSLTWSTRWPRRTACSASPRWPEAGSTTRVVGSLVGVRHLPTDPSAMVACSPTRRSGWSR